jgi:hypothetical protein
MKILLIISLFFVTHAIAAETAKPQTSLDTVVAEINKEKDRKIKDFTALVEAKKESSVVQALKSDKDYTYVNLIIQGDHILTYCIKNKMWKAAEELIKGGSNLNYKDEKGKVALMYAAEAKNRYVATMLIASKADKQIKDNAGVSAEEYLKKTGLE